MHLNKPQWRGQEVKSEAFLLLQLRYTLLPLRCDSLMDKQLQDTVAQSQPCPAASVGPAAALR